MKSILKNHRSTILTTSAAVLALMVLVAPGLAGAEHAPIHSHEDVSVPMDHKDLGAVSFPVSCSQPARETMERGVALLHHMMYAEARKTFAETAAVDPGCAMAHWGIAMTLFQPLWPTRPGPAELTKGWSAVETARGLEAPTPRELAYIEATAAFFQNPDSADYWARIRQFESAMEKVWRSYPDDQEAAAFYALSHLATASQSQQPARHNERAAEILLAIYDTEPRHPGAVHYTIHANDNTSRAGERLDVVRSYDDIAPSVPHALHMPTHIFVRLGAWEDVIHWNLKSADAALNFPAGDATSHHYAHALDYLMYARLQRGEKRAARRILDELASKESYQQTFISAYPLAAIPARYAVERSQWREAAALPERTPADFPWEKFAWPEAVTQFARGLGSARSGDVEGARRALERLIDLERRASEANETYFARQIEINRLTVEAWLAHAEGRDADALRLMRSASEIEGSTEKHPVTPGALRPAPELLGDLLQELGRPEEAIGAYEESLQIWPGRYNSLLGAARAADAAGDHDAASGYRKALQDLTLDGERSPAQARTASCPY